MKKNFTTMKQTVNKLRVDVVLSKCLKQCATHSKKYSLWNSSAKWPTIVSMSGGGCKVIVLLLWKWKRRKQTHIASMDRQASEWTNESRCLLFTNASSNGIQKSVGWWWHPTMPSSYKGELYVARLLSLSWTSVQLYITIINKTATLCLFNFVAFIVGVIFSTI